MLLSRYLDREGYGYLKATDGLETLELVRTHLPDLVLLDINMPHKDGFEVLGEIRADPITEHIPVIILTAARLNPAEIQSGLNMGADDYVTKPFDHKELMARIHTKLRVKQAEDMIRRQNRELKLLPGDRQGAQRPAQHRGDRKDPAQAHRGNPGRHAGSHGHPQSERLLPENALL